LSPLSEGIRLGWPVGSPGAHVPASDEQVLKACVRPLSFFQHGPQKFDKRFPTEWRALTKRYLSGDVQLCIGIVWGDGAVREQIGNHYALIQVAGAGYDDACVGTFDGEVTHQRDAAGRVNRNEFHVLVDIR